jgi:hypothetical protein
MLPGRHRENTGFTVRQKFEAILGAADDGSPHLINTAGSTIPVVRTAAGPCDAV